MPSSNHNNHSIHDSSLVNMHIQARMFLSLTDLMIQTNPEALTLTCYKDTSKGEIVIREADSLKLKGLDPKQVNHILLLLEKFLYEFRTSGNFIGRIRCCAVFLIDIISYIKEIRSSQS